MEKDTLVDIINVTPSFQRLAECFDRGKKKNCVYKAYREQQFGNY